VIRNEKAVALSSKAYNAVATRRPGKENAGAAEGKSFEELTGMKKALVWEKRGRAGQAGVRTTWGGDLAKPELWSAESDSSAVALGVQVRGNLVWEKSWALQ